MNIMKTSAQIIAFVGFIFLTCIDINAQQFDSINDSRDGKVYKTVRIGTQWWMAENLNYYTPAGSRYSNDDSSTYATLYGRLYEWNTAINSCPVGWHVPSHQEWRTMEMALGFEQNEPVHDNNLYGTDEGGKLKEAGITHWLTPNTGATNSSGFTALPAGHYAMNQFWGIGEASHFWAGNKKPGGGAWYRSLTNETSAIHIFHQDNGYKSVRCIEDPIPDTVKYFGQTPPGDSAKIFAPGIISLTNRFEGKITFLSNGKEIYFGTINPDDFSGSIYQSHYTNGTWSDPEVVPFSNVQSAYYPAVSMDGSRLYFEAESDIWMTERHDSGWGEPLRLPSPINSEAVEECATISSDGTLYFHSRRDGKFGTYGDIWRFRPGSEQAENLGSIVNSTNWQSHPCIAPDQSYLIFARNNESHNLTELYISFATDNEEWTTPINMNEGGCKINTNNTDHPSLSPDGKYFFFSPHDQTKSDIYWVSTSIIEDLRALAFPTSVNESESTQIRVFPNPASQTIQIKGIDMQLREANYQLIDLTGKTIKQGKLNAETIDISALPKGIYMLSLNTNEGVLTEKIVIE